MSNKQLELFEKPVYCAYCGKLHPHPFWVEKFTNKVKIVIAFCNERHANEYYLERLRESGM